MQFTNPIWLWALAGLLVPVGIHLLSRKEGKVVQMGSIRHLEQSNTKQSMSLQLNELMLLALRCLLITLVVLLLSGLHFPTDQTKKERWVVVEDGLDSDRGFIPIIDSLQKQGFLVKRLEEDFPDIQGSKTTSTRVNYWQLMEALKEKSLQQSYVLSYNYAEGFRGRRIAMPSNLTWISKSPASVEFPLRAVQRSRDSVLIRIGNSTPDETTFKNLVVAVNQTNPYLKSSSTGNSISSESPDTLNITIVSELEFEYDKKIILAALRALAETVPTIFIINSLKQDQWNADAETDWLIWLSNDMTTNGLHVNRIIYKQDETKNKPLLERDNLRSGEGTVWLITKRLNEDIALQEKLPLTLASILLDKSKSETRAAETDRRTQPEKMLWSREATLETKKIVAGTEVTTAAQSLVLLVFMVLFVERLVAIKRNQ